MVVKGIQTDARKILGRVHALPFGGLMKKILLLLLLVTLLCGCTCVRKDPRSCYVDWEDNKVRFCHPHFLVILRDVEGAFVFFFNTDVGWYETPTGNNIDYVLWCGG